MILEELALGAQHMWLREKADLCTEMKGFVCVWEHEEGLSLIHISEPTRQVLVSRMPSSA